jgi:hypothetical protein
MRNQNEKRIRKNIDLSEDCVKRLSKIAIDKGTDFKNFSQQILEKYCELNEPEKDKQPDK